MRILIAEDDPILADGLQRTLRHSGHAVDWVNNGAEADAALGTHEFDLLILDISLPRLSGFEVLKRLKSSRKTQFIPVIVLSGSADPADVQSVIDMGADEFLGNRIV